MDAQKDNLEDHAWIKCKLVDLEDRSRGNNIKVRRIAETVECEKCYAFTWLNCGGGGKVQVAKSEPYSSQGYKTLPIRTPISVWKSSEGA